MHKVYTYINFINTMLAQLCDYIVFSTLMNLFVKNKIFGIILPCYFLSLKWLNFTPFKRREFFQISLHTNSADCF